MRLCVPASAALCQLLGFVSRLCRLRATPPPRVSGLGRYFHKHLSVQPPCGSWQRRAPLDMGKGEKSAPAPESALGPEDRGSDEGLLPALEAGVKGEPQARTGHERTDCCKTTREKLHAGLTIVLLICCLTLIGLFVGRKNCESQSQLNDVNGNHFLRANITLLPPCPAMWVWYLGKCYNFSKEEGNWTSCNDICASWNSTLAVFETEPELDFLKKHKGTLEYWIGLRTGTDGVRRWVNGAIFNE
ncbi:early activation antigen CD69-like isoform X2 [Lissotriton helveticus]